MTAEITKHTGQDFWTIRYFKDGSLIDMGYASTEVQAYKSAREFIAVNK